MTSYAYIYKKGLDNSVVIQWDDCYSTVVYIIEMKLDGSTHFEDEYNVKHFS